MILKSHHIVFFLVLMAASFVCNSAQSQQDQIQFENISIDQGLSQSIVKCILQDKQGFIYFGTEDGLNRYDGYSFSVMRNNPEDENSLSYNDITSLYEDHFGNLWIGTFNGGLNKYNVYNKTITRFLNDPDNYNSISHNNINSIIEDDSGTVWIGTDNGLNKITIEDSARGTYSIERILSDPTNPNSLSHNIVHTVLQDQYGIIWVGTEGGLDKLILNQGSKNHTIFSYDCLFYRIHLSALVCARFHYRKGQ